MSAATLAATGLVLSAATAAPAAVYEPGTGAVPFYRFSGDTINERSTLAVNIASGNLLVTAHDLAIHGTGLDLDVTRYYNSLAPAAGDAGTGWSLSVGQDVRLTPQADGSADLRAATGFTAKFQPATGSGFTAPMGFEAVLAKTATAYELTDNGSQTKLKFPLAGGAVSSIVDKNGNTIAFTYNTSGKLTSIKDTQDRVDTVAYGTNGLSSITDSTGRSVHYSVSSSHDLSSVSDAAVKTTSYTYDAAHRLTRITDPLTNRTLISYDAAGRVSQFVRVDNVAASTGPTTTFAYNTGDSRCPAGTTSTRVTDPNGNPTIYCPNSERQVVKVIDARGNARSATYDPDANVTQLVSGSSTSTATWLDGGRISSATLATGAKTTYSYDDPSHKFFATTVTDPQLNTTNYTWTSNNLTKITDAAGGKTVLTYNGNGTVASSTAPKGFGMADPNPYKTTYQYDTKGNLLQVTPPTPLAAEHFTYDALSRLKTVTDGAGRTMTYTYDAVDHVTNIAYGDGSSILYTYDSVGDLVFRRGAEGDRSYVYDRLGRLVSESVSGGGASATYTYDNAGNLATLTDGGGQVQYAYDAVNDLARITDPGNLQTTFAYDDRDNRTQTTYPNGVTVGVQFDMSDRPTDIVARLGTAAPFVHRTYDYTLGSQDTELRQREQDLAAGTTTTYGFDADDRLRDALTVTTATGTTIDHYTYNYDANTNVTSVVHNGQQVNSTYNAADELTQSGSTTYAYDGAGNLLSSSAGLTMTYNGKGQTASIKPVGAPSPLPMTYAAAGQIERTGEGSTTFENDGLGLSASITAGARTSFTRDDDRNLVSERLPDGSREYYVMDGLGSVVALTDQTGAVKRTYAYDPYGATTATTGTAPNPFHYAGQYQGAASLYKMGQRYYDPAVARWTQQDPVSQSNGTGQGSRYTYADGDPIDRTDPTGCSPRLRVSPCVAHCAIVHCGDSLKVSQCLMNAHSTFGFIFCVKGFCSTKFFRCVANCFGIPPFLPILL
jgi:RHS repeat-associated protein